MAAIKLNACSVYFRAKRDGVLCYTWAAHDPVFSVSQSSSVRSKCCNDVWISKGLTKEHVFHFKEMLDLFDF